MEQGTVYSKTGKSRAQSEVKQSRVEQSAEEKKEKKEKKEKSRVGSRVQESIMG